MVDVSADALDRLAQYWGRAQIMRDLFNDLIDAHDGEIGKVIDEGYGLKLETFLAFWLAGLFVVVEGFNKLKLKDARIQTLFRAHLHDLKELRHETYHFTISRVEGVKAISALNWAEELHVAVGTFLEQHVELEGIVGR
jgi:hypothetical protein